MIVEAVISIAIAPIRLDIDKTILIRNKFKYEWWKEPMPPSEANEEDDIEETFKKLFKTLERSDKFQEIDKRLHSRIV